MEDNKNTFEYSYSALTERERKRIESIKRRYQTPTDGEATFERVKELDAKVQNTATVWSLVLGVVGCLVFGLGLTMVLEWSIFDFGIILMGVGCIPIAAAYPVYNALIRRGKKKYGEEILELSEKLLNK